MKNTRTLSPLATEIYRALNGKHLLNTAAMTVTGKYIGKTRQEKEVIHNIMTFNCHLPSKNRWGIKLDGAALEALVLIPEHRGVARVERAYNGDAAVYGFYTPEYTEVCIEAMLDAMMQYLSESKDVYKFQWTLLLLHKLLGKRNFSKIALPKYRELIAEGINSMEWKDKAPREQEEKLNSAFWYILHAKITGKDNPYFLKAIWEKAKTSPSGYMDDLVWEFIGEYLMETAPEITICCNFMKNYIVNLSLKNVLGLVPTNRAGVFREDTRTQYFPSDEERTLILDLIDKAIN